MDAWGNHTIFTLGNGARDGAAVLRGERLPGNRFGPPTVRMRATPFRTPPSVFDRIGNLVARSSKAGWGTSQSMEEFHYFDHLNRLVHTFANGWEEEALHYDKAGQHRGASRRWAIRLRLHPTQRGGFHPRPAKRQYPAQLYLQCQRVDDEPGGQDDHLDHLQQAPSGQKRDHRTVGISLRLRPGAHPSGHARRRHLLFWRRGVELERRQHIGHRGAHLSKRPPPDG